MMATFRPFAYNTGSTVSATTQVGDLAIGTNELPVSEGYGGLIWKNGPNEDLGYVIGYPQSGGTQPLPASGTGFVQFWRSKVPGDDNSFIQLSEYISRKYSTPQTFSSATDASVWLTNNGFWNSYVVSLTGYSFNLVATPYTFPSAGNSIMNNTGGVSSGSTDINVLATGGRGFYFNSFDNDGIDRTSYYSGFTGQSVTITFNQTGNTAIYSGDTNSFKYWESSPTDNGFVFGAGIGAPPTNIPSGTAILIQSASTPYNIGFPVYVSLVVN